MRRTPAAIRYLTLHRLAFCVTALTVLVTAVATAGIAAFAAAAATTANRETLADNPASSILVTATITQFAAQTASVARTIAHGASGLPVTFIAAPQSDVLDLPAGRGGRRAQTFLLGLSQVRQHARLSAGSWPSGTGAGAGAVQACLPVRAAQLLSLAPGDALNVRDSLGRAAFEIRISCTFTEIDPASPYWQLNAIGTAAVTKAGGFTSYGPMVTTAPSASWPIQPSVANWLAVPDFGAMTAPNLSDLGASIGAALSALSNSSSISPVVTTSLPTLLSDQAVALQVARSQLLIGQLILLVIAGASLAVAVNLLASQRAGEPGLLMARGATRRQLAAKGGTDAALLAIPAAIGGPLVGAWLAPQMARLGLIGTGSLSIPGGLPAVAWVAGVAVAAGCALIIALPWLRRPISPIRRRAGRVRQRTITAALSSGADIALVLLAVAASWQLAQYSAPVSTGVSGAIGVDPILVAAPVLALTAGTLIMLRLLPLLIRLTERVAARGRGITVPTAAWMISRRTIRQAGPALLTVLAVATAVIALGAATSWRESVQDQAGFTVGGDTSITLPAAAPLPIGQAGQITGARGVRAVTPVIRASFSLPDNDQATLLGLDPRPATAIVPLRHDLLVKPLTNPFGPIGEDKGPTGVVLSGKPTKLQVIAALSRSAMTGAVLAVQLSDAAGVSYQLTAGSLPANGTFQRLDISLSPRRQADYPVTLTGFSLQYQMPQFGPHRMAALTISSVSPAAASGRPGSAVPDIGRIAGPDPDLSSTIPQLMSWAGNDAFGGPAELTWIQRPRGAVLRFAVGAGSNSISGPGFPESADATLTVAAPPAAAALPAVATTAFLAASGQHLGSTIEVNDLAAPVPVRIVAEVTQFPTITSSGGGIVVSEPALQQYLEDNGGGPMSINEWWLSDTGAPAFGQLPAGSAITTKAAVATSLGSQPLEVAPLRSLLAVAVVALALAGLGFLVSASSSRERGRDLAVLDALGATPGQLARVLCLEQGMLSVPAAAGGLALGLLLSRLIIPAVTLTAQASHPIPSVLVRIPLTPALAVACVIAAVPIAAVALSVLGGTGTMARLRAEEEL
jgi:hypothetical protein